MIYIGINSNDDREVTMNRSEVELFHFITEYAIVQVVYNGFDRNSFPILIGMYEMAGILMESYREQDGE